MHPVILTSGLSRRTTNVLAKAGLPIAKRAISEALQTQKLCVELCSSTYGTYTHRQVCRWGVIPGIELRCFPLLQRALKRALKVLG